MKKPKKQQSKFVPIYKSISSLATNYRFVEIVGKAMILFSVAFQLIAIDALNSSISSYPEKLEEMSAQLNRLKGEYGLMHGQTQKYLDASDKGLAVFKSILNLSAQQSQREQVTGSGPRFRAKENKIQTYQHRIVDLEKYVSDLQGKQNGQATSHNLLVQLIQSGIDKEMETQQVRERYMRLGKFGFVIVFLLSSVLTLYARILEFKSERDWITS